MIFSVTVDKINTQLATTDLFQKSWGLCELIIDGGGLTLPAFYLGKSEYDKKVVDFDKYIGVSYIRRNGKVTFGEVDPERQPIDCKTVAELIVPLKVVCIVPKRELPQDNEYADDFVASKITAALNGASEFISDANSSRIFVQDYETDNQVILSEEFAGTEITNIHYKYSYLSLQVIARIIIDSTCLEPECNPCYS